MTTLRVQRFSRPAIATLFVLVGCFGIAVAAERPPARIEALYEERVGEIKLLATADELAVLASLNSNPERERFLREFWVARGPSARERMRANRLDAQRLALRSPGQSDIVLLAGKPTRVHSFDACQSVVRRIEIWEYSGWRVDRQRQLSDPTPAVSSDGVFLAFVQRTNLDPRSFELWARDADSGRLVFGEGRGVAPSELVSEAVSLGCVSPTQAGVLRRGLQSSLSRSAVAEAFGWPPPSAWWERDEPLGGAMLSPPGSLQFRASGKFFRQTLMTGQITVPVGSLRTLDGSDLFDRVEIIGDVYAGDRLIDPFRAVHHLAGPAPSQSIELDFYRRLLPGRYTVRVRAENSSGRVLVRETLRLVVPVQENDAGQPPGRSRDINQLTREEVVFLTTSPSVELIQPENFPLSGPVTVEAVARGRSIEAVEFVPEVGASVSVKSPPYLAEIAMDTSRVRLKTKAVGTNGRVLAEDAIVLRRDARPFRVWFDRESSAAGDSLDAQHTVWVQLPEEESLVWLGCFNNGEQVAQFEASELAASNEAVSRYACPRQPPRADTARLRFDRVVARLSTGEEVEDVLVVSQQPEALDVRLVELFVSVLDRQGRPVTGLTADSFSVVEDGQVQRLEKVTAVERLPLAVSVMMDTSSSMGRRVRFAVRSTQQFFKELMRDGDVASLFAFQHDLLSLVDFTRDAGELDYAAQGLRGSGGTRLFDGLIYNLHSFVGLPARRAMVVLSDGADTESDATASEALEAARRSGVLVFPVALGDVGEATELELRSLAQQTGGSFFQVSGVNGLNEVYTTIVQILRSQYQVVYRPLQERTDRGYQQVEIKLNQPGLSVRNVRGYYR